ncbi:filamentous hemagglutinin N-terminal domain-containing protein [Bradyrhizobium sp. RDT10]
MSDNRFSAHFVRTRFFQHAALLASVSAVALLMADTVAYARPMGGQRASAPSQAAIAAAQSASQDASRAAQQATNALRRATQAIQAMQAAQQAVRNLPPSTVPNGLRPGGLVVMPGATSGATDGGAGLWQGANLPTETQNGGRTQVTVKQNEQKAILTWKEFNVGRETDLYFDQRAGGADAKNWIALNRVMDPGAAPSKILGSIKAEGQVYLINRNGIIFGAGSQVNVGTLVASSLGLSNRQFMAGINSPLALQGNLGDNGAIIMPQFGYLGQQQPDDKSIDDPGQVPGVVIGDAPGDVRVEAGGQITTAGGGKVMLFAPKVFNSGHISAPDGQVIMAAGEQVWLTSSGTVRGLDVAVSAPMRWMFAYTELLTALGRIDPFGRLFPISVRDVILPEMKARAAAVGYTVVNDGIVQADRGNITVMARDIVQNGALLAMTALNNREGSIRLLAWDQGMACSTSSFCELGALKYWSTGTLTLAPGSVTATMPDLSDASEIELASLATRYKPGQIDLQAAFINIRSQANVIAPAGTINLVGRAFELSDDLPKPRDGSRIYVGEDACLSVAGLKDISVAMERNIVEAELRINELRDSPFYRDSWLRGMKVKVDRRASGMFTDGPMSGVQWGGSAGEWIGTPLADVSAWVGNGKTDLGELSTIGGSISIATSGSLITRTGSILDVSGGSVRYRDGWVDTTKLLGADGRSYDIGRAAPDMVFVGLASGFTRNHDRAGVTENWTSLLSRSRRFEKGYTEGRNAGSIQMSAAEGIVLEGSYWGGVTVGERQAAAGEIRQCRRTDLWRRQR